MKKFLNILPDLKLSHEMTELFETVECEKVAASRDHSRIKIYIHSDRLIAHKAIRETERAIRSQMFKDQVDVCLVEKYHLSRQYTPARLLEAYTGSLIDELEEEGELSANLFRKAEKTFLEPFVLELKVEENCIAQVKMEKLKHKLEHIFSERFDMPLEIVLGWLPKKKSKYAVYADSAMKEEIAQIVQTYEQAKEDQKEVEKQEVQQREKPAFKKNYVKQRLPEDKDIFYGRNFEGEETEIHEIIDEMGEVVVRGKIIQLETREIRNEKTIVMFAVTDFTDTIKAKVFTKNERLPELLDKLKEGAFIKMKAVAMMDQFEHDIALGSVSGIKTIPDFTEKRMDHSPVKRVELHCHTTMSDMDGVTDVKKLLKTAMGWGHQAMAITDHGVVQAFPDANHCVEGKDFKVIYGMEGYLVDDIKNIVTDSRGQSLDSTFVVFDIETTGFSAVNDRIIEIGAVKVENGMITEKFSEFVNPERPIPFEIEKLTSINDRMVEDAPNISVILPKFMDFCGGSVLVAHNADFDTGFIRHNCEVLGLPYDYTYVDTLGIARSFLEGLKNYKLDTVVEAMGCTLANHHRAVDDAGATADVFVRFLERFKKKNIRDLDELNTYSAMSVDAIKKLKTYHIILLAKNEIGRINLYRLVSLSHLDYYARRPRIPKSVLAKYREGLIIGSACEAGELFRAVVDERPEEEIARIVEFYDYLEIQPTGNNEFMIRDPKMTKVSTVADLQDLNRKIVELGEKFNKPVCATCDVHFLNPEDEVYRRIIMSNKGFGDADLQPPLYLRTTEEMLEEFQYLGAEKAEEVVVTNTNRIADMIDRISPVRPDKCPPVIENSAGILRDICYNRAHELYGEDLPDIVTERLERELNSIIGNGFAVMYIIAQKLVWKSVADGYLVGSRGSVGSSFVAYMAGITEVNSLQAHYLCPKCHYVDFDSDYVKSFSGRSGCDMEDRVCPVCGEPLMKEGHDIPFETFLGFKGNKEPDIDLNFSGDYQSKAHAYTEVIFGKGKTFRAGTVGTLADKTAYGYAMHYYEEHEQHKRSCELDRISSGCVGVRRTTGQHPGGIIVVPHGEEIYSFTPVQHPANDQTTKIITTHFDYHSIDHNLLKLDILGHDDPTMIRMLEDITGVDATKIRLDDPEVLSLFHGLEALHIKPEDIGGTDLGSLGIPEFGTEFVMQMLRDTKPKAFSDLVRISGLSHGTDVWLGNAQTLIQEGKAQISTAICTRDDIMIYLIDKGVESEQSFKIMESVRKGKGLTPDYEKVMKEHDVPDWYLWSCKKIKYMFPKAHAVAYVMMGIRIAWFKIHEPLAYYAAFFTIRATAFDYGLMCQGKAAIDNHIKAYKANPNLSKKEQDTLRDMKIVQEFYARGFEFLKIDLYQSDAIKFQVVEGKLLPPFSVIEGMGGIAAEALAVAAHAETERGEKFLSKDDIRQKAKVSQTVLDTMDELGLLGGLPESNQLSIFDFGF
ncbi:MAG: PolC-type DNA polymerase III [Coprococcus catus]|uniref:DNA polymerase III PolC-type n=1 Tax=Coprococcus intestinihominis TaxID=3133154 RepID=A0ABV1B378_9FIRM|nr:PolC-type DNA polymerase III [Coprococcus catus]MDY5988771.1 PolC-type DNA polymerase III [Coprococcus catus]